MRRLVTGVHMRLHVVLSRLAVLFALLSISLPASAAVGQWTPRGPEGGEIDSFVIDPQHPGTLYAGAFAGGVFKSTDAGRHWSEMTTGMAATAIIRALAVDPQNSQNVFAGTSDGLYTSNNGGSTWTLRLFRDVQAVAVDPVTPANVYVGSCSDNVGLYKSVDGGATWVPSNSGLTNICVGSVSVDPGSPSTIFGGTGFQSTNGVFKSVDGGSTWSPSGLEQWSISSVVVDPTSSGTVYALGDGGLAKSTDGGQTWSRLPAGNSVFAFALAPSSSSVLFVSTAGGVKRSADGGMRWTSRATGLPTDDLTTVLAVNPNRSNVIYAGTRFTGVYASIRSGRTWKPANTGLYAQEITALAVSFGPSDMLYAGTWHGLFKSADSGASWTVQAAVPDDQPIRDVVISPASARDVYVATDFGVYRSLDGG